MGLKTWRLWVSPFSNTTGPRVAEYKRLHDTKIKAPRTVAAGYLLRMEDISRQEP